MGGTNEVKAHPSGFRAEQQEEIGGVWAVEGINNSLSLGNRGLSIKPTPFIANVITDTLKQVESLCVVGHQNNPRERERQITFFVVS